MLNFARRMETAGGNTFTQKRQEHPVNYKSRGRRTVPRRFDLKQHSDCSGRGECQTAQDGVEEDSGEEDEENGDAEDEVVEELLCGLQRGSR